MVSKYKSSQGIAHPILLFVVIMGIGIIVYVLLFNKDDDSKQTTGLNDLSTKTKDTVTIEESVAEKSVMTDWETYASPTYNYEISNPGDWILTVNNLANSDINLRLNSDGVPARSGFSIAIIENPKYKTMKEMCDNGEFNENTGILCSDEITQATTTIGEIAWEKIEGDSIGVIPSFNVVLSTYYMNNIYYVVSEGYSIEQISEVLKSFSYIN